MSNKTWEYVVTIQHPEDWEATPAQRRELSYGDKATSAPRAISKIKKRVAQDFEMEVRHVEVLDACRTSNYRNDVAEEAE